MHASRRVRTCKLTKHDFITPAIRVSHKGIHVSPHASVIPYTCQETRYDAIYFTHIPHLRPNKPSLECNNVPRLFPCPNLAIYQSSPRQYVTTNTTYPSRRQAIRTVIYNHTYIPYLRLNITPCNSTLLHSYRIHPHGDTGRRREGLEATATLSFLNVQLICEQNQRHLDPLLFITTPINTAASGRRRAWRITSRLPTSAFEPLGARLLSYNILHPDKIPTSPWRMPGDIDPF